VLALTKIQILEKAIECIIWKISADVGGDLDKIQLGMSEIIAPYIDYYGDEISIYTVSAMRAFSNYICKTKSWSNHFDSIISSIENMKELLSDKVVNDCKTIISNGKHTKKENNAQLKLFLQNLLILKTASNIGNLLLLEHKKVLDEFNNGLKITESPYLEYKLKEIGTFAKEKSLITAHEISYNFIEKRQRVKNINDGYKLWNDKAVAAQLHQESKDAELSDSHNLSNNSIEENIIEEAHAKTGEKLILTERIQFNSDDYI